MLAVGPRQPRRSLRHRFPKCQLPSEAEGSSVAAKCQTTTNRPWEGNSFPHPRMGRRWRQIAEGQRLSCCVFFSSKAPRNFIFPQGEEVMDTGEATTVSKIIKEEDNLLILVLISWKSKEDTINDGTLLSQRIWKVSIFMMSSRVRDIGS